MNRSFIDILQQGGRVLAHLCDNDGATPEELCQAGNCTSRTLLRVINNLREICGADIRWDTKRQRYSMINRHDFVAPEVEISKEAIVQHLCSVVLHHAQPGTMSAHRLNEMRNNSSTRLWSTPMDDLEH